MSRRARRDVLLYPLCCGHRLAYRGSRRKAAVLFLRLQCPFYGTGHSPILWAWSVISVLTQGGSQLHRPPLSIGSRRELR